MTPGHLSTVQATVATEWKTMSDEQNTEKKIIIDEDWKSQVEAEKQKANEPQREGDAPGKPSQQADANDPPMPPASMQMLVSTLATEAMMSLGQIPHPMTGETVVQKSQAKYLIDTIEILKDKTVGNIPADETAAIGELLHTLRLAFVQIK